MKQKTCYVCGKNHTVFRYLKLCLMGRWAVRIDCKKCSAEEDALQAPYWHKSKGKRTYISLHDMLLVDEEMKKRHPHMRD